MRKLLLTALFIIRIATAQNPSLNWVAAAGSTTVDQITSIKVDASGNTFCTGKFQGTVDFDPGTGTTTLTSFGSYDAFVSKFNSAGVFQWVKQIGGINQDVGNGIDVDASGNIYVVGNFRDLADFDPSPSTFTLIPQNTDVFVLKLNSSGNFVWVKKFGGFNYDYGYGIAVDNSGNVHTTGSFEASVDFDPGPGSYSLTSPGSATDLFVSKLDASGNFVWARRVGGGNNDEGRSIDCDALSNVVISGITRGSVDLDPGTGVFTHPGGSSDGVTIKLDALGNFIWANAIGAGGNDEQYGTTIDSQGNVLVTGNFAGTVDFDYSTTSSSTIQSSGGSDAYVCKYSSSGGFQWAKAFKGTGTESGLGITTGAFDDIYVSGELFGTTNFDSGVTNFTLASTGGFDAFAAKISFLGNFEWAIKTGGTGGDAGYSISTNGASNVLVGGYFNGTSDFNPGVGTSTLTSANDDMFLLCLCSQPPQPGNSTPNPNLNICANNNTTLTAFSGIPTSTLNWYSTNTSTTIIGTGSTFVTPTLSAGTYTYYVANKTCAEGPRALVLVNVAVCSGIEEVYVNSGLLIYPNPAKQDLKIRSPQTGQLAIYDLTGKHLQTILIDKELNDVTLPKLATGLYVFVFHGSDHSILKQKVLIEN